jgi:hypothetical protein
LCGEEFADGMVGDKEREMEGGAAGAGEFLAGGVG